MSNTSVIDGTKIDLSKITFSSIKRNDNGSKSVRVSYNGGPLTIQTPLMPIPWNLNPPYSEKNANAKRDEEGEEQNLEIQTTGRVKWSLQMSFRGREGNRRLQKFYENMKALDDLFAKTTVEKRQEWFDDDDEYESEREAALAYKKTFKPGVREKKNKTTGEAYPPCIEPKVTCENGEFACNCFNMKREKFDKPMNKLQLKGTEGEGIIRLTNFYIQESRCGPTWTLMRLRADESEGALGEFGFIDIAGEEDGNETTEGNVEIHTTDEEDNGEDAETGEEEGGDAEEEEDEPSPEPEKPKTTRKRTTTTTRRKKD